MCLMKNLPNNSSVWQHPDRIATIISGDSLELLPHIPDNSIDCIWTDPPYNLSNDGVTCVAGKMVSVNKGEWDRSKGIEGDYQFNLAWTKECFRILRHTGTIWVTGTLHVHSSIGMALQQSGFRLLNDIIWEKLNPPPNLGCRTFTHSTELMYWASKAQKGEKHKYKFNYQLMKQMNGGKQMKSVWKLGAASKTERKFGRHPTQKPIQLIQRSILASTDKGEVVLDPFSGSGSTGVAALSLKRKFIGIEQIQEYIDLSIKRIESINSADHQGKYSIPPPPPPPDNHHQNDLHSKIHFIWIRSSVLPPRGRKPEAWKGQTPSFSRTWLENIYPN